MIDETPRIVKVLDALSQMVNVGLLPNHIETHANESISGRSYRKQWRIRHVINALFFWQEDHCRLAHVKDIERAKQTIAALHEVRR